LLIKKLTDRFFFIKNKKDINLIYVESPLQFFSAMDFLDKNKNSLLYYYHYDKELEKIIFLSKYFHIARKSSIYNFVKLLFRVLIKYNINNVGVGDIRSTRSLVLIFLTNKSTISLFDDGNYSSNFDQGGDYKINLGNKKLKSPLIRYIFSNYKINRCTFLKHDITRNYNKITKFNAPNIVKNFNLMELKRKIKAYNKSTKTFFYIESNLDGWINKKHEQKIYDLISKHCVENDLKLVILAHRLSSLNRIREFIKGFKDAKCIKLNIPVELFFIFNDHPNFTFGFSITSAVHTGLIFIKKSNFVIIKISESLIFNMYKQIVKNHYDRLYQSNDQIKNKYLELVV